MSRRRRRREPGIIREILGWIFYIIVILVLTYVIITYVGQRIMSAGHPWRRLKPMEISLVICSSYRFQDPKRFDIIVFPYQYEENTYYIKRIIGPAAGDGTGSRRLCLYQWQPLGIRHLWK